MSLINCRDCDHKVSDLAQSCPECGRPMDGTAVDFDYGNVWRMIRNLAVLTMVVSLIWFLIGILTASGSWIGSPISGSVFAFGSWTFIICMIRYWYVARFLRRHPGV